MKETEFHFKSKDGELIYAIKWESESNARPKGIVQIVHGMAEHIGRYRRFAESLTQSGFLVFGNDHRGHGRTAPDDELIFFHEESGWEKVLADLKQLYELIREEEPYLPVFLFGHSMGSFLSKCYIQRHGGDLSGVILSGTGFTSKWANRLPLWLAERDVKRYGPQGISKTLAPIVSKRYTKPFKPLRTESDWLSRDQAEVDLFVEDAHCGKMASAGFYRDMIRGMGEMDDPIHVAQIPKALPIFLISGDQDVVGDFGKGVHKTAENYKKAGLQQVELKLYKGARHELLNETNRDEVTTDILSWLDLRLNSSSNVSATIANSQKSVIK